MRIALLLYGRINKFKEHYHNIITSMGKDNIIDIFYSGDNIPTEMMTEFLTLYNPVLYNSKKIEYSCNLGINIVEGFNIDNMARHFINKNRVFKLLEEHVEKENIIYDVIISTRIDIVYDNNIIFSKVEENTIYIPSGADWCGGLNDQIAYGDILSMKKYMSIYDNCIPLLKNNLSKSHPESLTLANIKLYNLNVIRFGLKYYIDR